MNTPVTTSMSEFSHGQQEALRLLIRDLSVRTDLTDRERLTIVENRRQDYRQRNTERSDRRTERRMPSPSPTGAAEVGWRYSMTCIDCDFTFGVPSAKPRKPLCPRCRDRRESKRIARQKERRAEA